MADDSPTPTAGPARKGGLSKPVLGLPVWMWGAGGVVLIGAYLYLRHSQASSASSSQQKPAGSGQPVAVVGSPTGLSLDQFLLLLEDMQGGKSKGKGHGRHGGGHHQHHHPGPNPGGPERQWLERITGSKHPWTYLAQHHERVVVGPHGSRRIIGGKKGGRK